MITASSLSDWPFSTTPGIHTNGLSFPGKYIHFLLGLMHKLACVFLLPSLLLSLKSAGRKMRLTSLERIGTGLILWEIALDRHPCVHCLRGQLKCQGVGQWCRNNWCQSRKRHEKNLSVSQPATAGVGHQKTNISSVPHTEQGEQRPAGAWGIWAGSQGWQCSRGVVVPKCLVSVH